MHDTVIRGGTIVDGTGAPAFVGDVAIDNGLITQVGGTAGPAKRDVNAVGKLVTPGWVDVHTHYEARRPGIRCSRPHPGTVLRRSCSAIAASASRRCRHRTARR
ncbi:MAG: amidohydrolase [Rhodospirillales bacterium]|nr:amidohydrolase [Rhodospirillales bacterium]